MKNSVKPAALKILKAAIDWIPLSPHACFAGMLEGSENQARPAGPLSRGSDQAGALEHSAKHAQKTLESEAMHTKLY